MKTVTVAVPTYNEEDNIADIIKRVTAVFEEKCPGYEYNILFSDDGSSDSTPALIEKACAENKHIKAILNAANVGYTRNLFYTLTQSCGDCVILLHADLQNPPEYIPQFIEQWEQGKKIVLGIKQDSNENRLMYSLRNTYYSFMKKAAYIRHVDNFTDFELLDAEFIEFLKTVKDPEPYLRGIVAEFSADTATVPFIQEKRTKGKSHFPLASCFDFAMLGMTSYSKKIIHMITLTGFILLTLSTLFAIGVIIYDLCNIKDFSFGFTELAAMLAWFSSMQYTAVALIGEYVLRTNIREMAHPLTREVKRINFD